MTNVKNIYKKGVAKALLCSAILAPAFCASSCSDYLETEPQNLITLEKFWNDKSDVQSVITGCYSAMQNYGVIARMMIWGEFRSENVNYAGDGNEDTHLARLMKEDITASNFFTNWNEFYDIINRCNTVLKYAPGVAEKDPSYSTSQYNAHVAEVTAIRSLMYFYLIRTFRDVPYSEEAYIDDSQTLTVAATSFDEVLANCINALEAVKDQAVDSYASTGEYGKYYNTGRITKWTIYAMLSEMYLWQKNYAKCIEYAELVIKHKKEVTLSDKSYSASDFEDYNGYPLLGTRYKNVKNRYGNAFNQIFVDGNSIESIFEITFIKGSGSSQSSNGPFSNFFGGQGRKPWITQSSYVGLDEVDALYKVYDKQNAGLDARAYENVAYESKTPSYINKTTCMTSVYLYNKPTSTDFYKNSSWGSQYDTYGSNHDSRNKANVIIYRLTDIMLLAAEAATQQIQQASGELTSDADKEKLRYAFNIVNAINKRSVMEETLKDTLVADKYKTKDAITELVYQERHRELMFEGKRFFDLVRISQREGNTEYLRKCCANKATELQSVINSKMQKMDAIYWPINLDELKANKMLKQNPAFGSGENENMTVN